MTVKKQARPALSQLIPAFKVQNLKVSRSKSEEIWKWKMKK